MKDQQRYKSHIELIWKIANLLRGPYRPPQYRKVMLPLIVLRRLDCVLEATKKQIFAEHQAQVDTGKTAEVIEKIINQKFKLTFHNTSQYSFANLLDDPDKLAANLVNYMAGFSGKARKIIEKFKFEEEIEKLDEANRLYEIIKEFKEVDLHPDRIANIAMGYIFEDLVRRFNEQANEEAGDHFTPREVIKLMVSVLYDGEKDIYKQGIVRTIYDPTCGTGGMLSVSEEFIKEHNPQANLQLFGQEYNPESYAICGSDLLIKGEEVNNIVFGDTLGDSKTGDGHADKKFHYMLANPPFGVEWKPEQETVTHEFNTLGFKGRFGAGLPRINDGALLFLLHMMSKMQPSPEQDGEGSRIAIVFNGSPLFTGDAGSGESNIRRWIIENDRLEAVIALPNQMFYNTGIFTYIWIVSNRKPKQRQGKVQLINAVDFFVKMKKSLGDKRNEIGDGEDGKPDHIAQITQLYSDFKNNQRCKILNNREFGYLKITVERPLRLSFTLTPDRLEKFKQTAYFQSLAVSKKRKDKEAIATEQAQGLAIQERLLALLQPIMDDRCFDDREDFFKLLKITLEPDFKLDAPLKSALVDAFGEKDPTAQICKDSKGNPEPDADLRDTENVPLPDSIVLPLPLDYEGKENKGKVDKAALLALVQAHCEAYLKREVLPYRSDAWIDHSKVKVGFEIPLNRHFYQYQPPRELAAIETDIKGLEAQIMDMLREVV
jgi:type I restriction enzyme M protein